MLFLTGGGSDCGESPRSSHGGTENYFQEWVYFFPLFLRQGLSRSLSPLSSAQSPESHLPNTGLIYSKLAAALQTSSLFSCVLLPYHLWNSVVTDASHCVAVVTVCVHIRVCVSMCLCVLMWISGSNLSC